MLAALQCHTAQSTLHLLLHPPSGGAPCPPLPPLLAPSCSALERLVLWGFQADGVARGLCIACICAQLMCGGGASGAEGSAGSGGKGGDGGGVSMKDQEEAWRRLVAVMVPMLQASCDASSPALVR